MIKLLYGRQRKALAASYLFFFSILGLLIPYLGVYLTHLGFDSSEIGSLLAIIFATRMVAPNLWAAWSDHSGRPVLVIKVGAVAGALTFSGLFWAEAFWPLVIVLCLYSFFWNAILSQLEVATLISLGDRPQDYGSLRSFGSVGYILAVVLIGAWFSHSGPATLPIIGFVLFLALALACLTLIEPTIEPKEAGSGWGAFARHLGQPAILVFLLAALLIQASHGPFYGFFVLFMKQLGIGEGVAGGLVAFGVVIEIGLFLIAPKLLGGFRLTSLLIFCCLVTACRWVLTWLMGDSIPGQAFAQGLHAISFGLSHACAIHFIHSQFSRDHQAKAQALYASISFGLGGAIGAGISGQLWQNGAGAQQSWFAAALAALLACACVLGMRYKGWGDS